MKLNQRYSTMRSAWTVIELIFIMVIIGILAAVALPKLAATRDDAKLATDISNMSLCIREVSSRYMATNIDLFAVGDTKACDLVQCYNIPYGSSFSNFTVSINTGPPNYCSQVDVLGGHLAKTYVLSGANVSY